MTNVIGGDGVTWFLIELGTRTSMSVGWVDDRMEVWAEVGNAFVLLLGR
jgi:hypothetical protein